MRRLALALLVPLAGCGGTLPMASNAGSTGRVVSLLDGGADVNERWPSWHNGTGLMAAAGNGHIETVRVLLQRGADVNARNDQGDSALGMALYRHHAEIVRLLIEGGAVAGEREKALARTAGMEAWLAPVKPAPEAEAAAADAADDGPKATDAAEADEAAPAESDVDRPSWRGTPRPHDFALVVGIEAYQGLPRAQYGERDAAAVARSLEALGVPRRNIVTLAGSSATGTKLKSYLEEWLPRNVREDSTLFVYFSGHGAPDPRTGEAFLVPWDGDPEFLKSTAYPLSKLYQELAQTKARRVVVALDACFSGAGGRSVLAKGARPLVAQSSAVAPGGRITVLAAAAGDQITGTLEEQGHGMFTYFLLKGLQEGKRSAAALLDYVKPRVEDEARRQNREQTPILLGEDSAL